MKKVYIALLAVIAGAFVFYMFSSSAQSSGAGDFKYVGVDKCTGACHKGESKGNQLEIWQASKHAQAYKTLQTPEADEIAKGKGFTTAAAETPECLKCHVLGKTMDPSEFEETFDMTQGVQCESCHGPGSEYKKLSIMKDREKAIANGMVVHSEGEAFCTGCHNEESPTFKGFNYTEMWDKIKHPTPEGAKE